MTVSGWAAEIGLVGKRVKVGVPGHGGAGLTLNASHLKKNAPRRGKNGACFFEKCDSQYETFGGVLGRVDLTGNSQKHRGNRQLTSPKVKFFSGRRKFSGLSRLFSIFSLFTTKNGVK